MQTTLATVEVLNMEESRVAHQLLFKAEYNTFRCSSGSYSDARAELRSGKSTNLIYKGSVKLSIFSHGFEQV